jgi:hypothetical protein
MGYYVTLTESSFRIPHKNLDEAYKRMCELNKHDDLKRGGSFGGDGTSEKWFSWMDANYPETCTNAAAIFEDLRFEIEITDTHLVLARFDCKYGQEELFLAAISDLAEPGSQMYWEGEDNQRWMFTYGGKTPIEYEAKVEYVPSGS